ncbi:MAG: AAA family ATPase [Solobacterium sp.]|nr:AAA family ATPase [Solobacterium sp.]
MFIAREIELKKLKEEFLSPKKTAILVYGKRRIGKSTLIAEASKNYSGLVINHLCIQSSFEGNMRMLSRSICRSFNLPDIQFSALPDVFDFIKKQGKDILIILDEYQYMKQSLSKYEVDSIMQSIIDRLPPNIKLVLCGSYITVMRELMEEANPLFGRFSTIIHLEEMDYYDASGFFPLKNVNEKIAYYAIFGGSPYVLSALDYSATIEENIKKLLLPHTSVLRTYIENIMLKEIQKAYDVRIFEILGNGKKKYSEIRNALGLHETGNLDKQLKNLLTMESVTKAFPVNKPDDRKKQFYEIKDNLMRFYFAFIFGNETVIERLGEDAFFENYISTSFIQFISRRFESIVLQYFRRSVRSGRIKGILDFGTYWYDDPARRKNGEFDCVIKTKSGYDFYECKYYTNPMSEKECIQEEKQLKEIQGISSSSIGFVCSSGFQFNTDRYQLIKGTDLYYPESQ